MGLMKIVRKFVFELFNQKTFDHIGTELNKMHRDLSQWDGIIQEVTDVKAQNQGRPDHHLPIEEEKLRAFRSIEKDGFYEISKRFLTTINDEEVLKGLKLLYDVRWVNGIDFFGQAPFDYKEAMLGSYIIAARRGYPDADILDCFADSRYNQLLKAYLMSDHDTREKVADATIELLKKLQHPETGKLSDTKNIYSYKKNIYKNNLDFVAHNEGVIDMIRLSKPDTTARLFATIMNGLTQEEAQKFLSHTILMSHVKRNDELYQAFLKHAPKYAELGMKYSEGRLPIRRYRNSLQLSDYEPDRPDDLGLS